MSYQYHDKDRDGYSGGGSGAIWTRGLIMLLLMVCFSVAQWVLYVLAVIQFLWMLIKSERNAFLAQFGHSLGAWLAETAHFLSGATDEKPFPWKPWPEG